jgi:filamentous hemagglutinin family protein
LRAGITTMQLVIDPSLKNTHKNHLKTLPAVIKRLLMAEAVGAMVLGWASLAQANPTGGEVAAGTAEIVQQGARMDINQASQRAVINWQSFNIDKGEHVNFNQPGRDAATLNRVVGNDPSAILGRMTANGNIYLVNQNGIMVGKDAEINVGSLTASTANISNQDFMAGRMNFAEPGNPDARIVNHGNITVQQGGLVALVAPGVENHGTINARLGKIALASGDAFTLDLYGDQLINLTVTKEQLAQISSAEGKPLSHYVSNTGEIIADGGMVTILAGTGKAIVDSLINLKGHVQAQTVENRNGVITLLGDDNTQVNVAGTLDASGQTVQARGGRVEVRGGEVQLAEGSRIDVSGNGQGGTVLIGGDFQGSGEGVRARTTTVERNAVIEADSHNAGDGGRVIVWADDHTQFDGTISARGGSESGDGGLVEVSGKQTLHYDGEVDASAKYGKAGELLLDPGDLVVKEMTAEENKTAAKPDTSGSVTTTTMDAAVNVQKVNYLLQNGTSVSLKAGNDLTVESKIDGRATDGVAGAGLSLTAGRHANIKADVLTNNGKITVKAETGNIIMDPGKVLYAGNQAIDLDAGGNVDAQHLVTTDAIDIKAGGNVALNQALAGDTATNGTPEGIGSLQIDAKGNVGLNGILANGPVTVANANRINVNKTLLTKGAVDLSGSELTVADGTVIDTRGVAHDQKGHAITLKAEKDMVLNGDLVTRDGIITATNDTGSITAKDATTIDAGAGAIQLTAAQDLTVSNLTTLSKATLTATNGAFSGKGILAAEDLTLTAKGNIAMNDVCVTKGLACGQTNTTLPGSEGTILPGREGTLLISSDGDLTHTGTFIADRNLDFQAKNGALSLGQVDLRKTGAILEATAKSITLNDNVVTRNGEQTYTTEGGAFLQQRGSGGRPNQLDSGTGKITITTKGSGDVTLNGTVLAKQAGLKVTTESGAVTFNEALGYAKDGDPGTPDPDKAVGSVQVKAGGKITINKDWNIAGNDISCSAGDCSAKIIHTGNNDIVINGRIKTATGNILIGAEDLLSQNFGNGKIKLGNSIFTEGEGASIFINGNLDLVNSGGVDVEPRVITKTTKEETVDKDGNITTIINEEITDIINSGRVDVVPRIITSTIENQHTDKSTGIKTVVIETKIERVDLIPDITLSASKGSLNISGTVSALVKYNDTSKPFTYYYDNDNGTAVQGFIGNEPFTGYHNGTEGTPEGTPKGATEVFKGTRWTTSPESFGGVALRLVAKDDKSLGFNVSDGLPSPRLFDVTGSMCCDKQHIEWPTIEDTNGNHYYNADINQYGKIEKSNEYHYLIMGGVTSDNNTKSIINTSTSITINNNGIGMGSDGSFNLPEFNQINTSLGQVTSNDGQSSANYLVTASGSRLLDPDYVGTNGGGTNGGGTNGGGTNGGGTNGGGTNGGGTNGGGTNGGGTNGGGTNGGGTNGGGTNGGGTNGGGTNGGNNESGASNSITKQTSDYADQSGQQETVNNEAVTAEESEYEIVLGGGSEAENADLGRNSPETGATQDTYARRHHMVCNGKSIKAGGQLKVPACRSRT